MKSDTPLIYPETFEDKIGFTAIRHELSANCSGEKGKEYAEAMRFSTDPEEITLALERTAEMLSILTSGEAFPLGGLHNVAPALMRCRVEGASLTLEELHRLRQTLVSSAEVAGFFSSHTSDEATPTFPRLSELCSDIECFPSILKTIGRLIDDTGEMLDTASPELGRIRRELQRVRGSVGAIMRRVMASAAEAGMLDKDAAPTIRDGRLVLPIAPMHKRKIQGIVHDESATGKTCYIEPAEVVEANNRTRELEIEELREIARILQEFTASIRPDIPAILRSYDTLGHFDFISAKARMARDCDATLPHIEMREALEWYNAVHPGLLQSLRRQNKEIVPLDIRLTPESRILVISGPNAGGKSVTLKTVGIIQYMMQCGMLPPVYENSRMGIFESIFIDIGDDQSIDDDLSTYSSHLRNMRVLLGGNESSLILIDEFGGGTEPQIGGAIAQALLHAFNDRHMWGIVTTHYQNLKHYASETPGLINGSMLYDRQKMRPLFRLSIGQPGSSFAIEIARKSGLPADIIDEAAEIVGSDYVNLDKYLLDIARDKRYWENKRMQIRQKEKKIEQTLERYENEAETLRANRRTILAEAKEEAKKILEGSNATIERTIREIRESQADKERTRAARAEMQKERQRLASDTPAVDHTLLKKAPKAKKPKQTGATAVAKPLAVGDFVKLDGQGAPGTIIDLQGQNATVAFGQLKTSVKLSRLTPTLSRPTTAAGAASFVSEQTTSAIRQKQLQFKRELDVRGMRVDEALQAVTYFLDDAIQFNQGEVRILHGTGTGALRQAIRQALDATPGVASYRDEHPQFGGAGITVITLA